jgi:hypothetical protein
MDQGQLNILHDHYRDTCSVLKGYRATRDWCFYLVILIVAVAWFDVVAPDDFARVTAESLKSKFQLTSAPNLTYLRGVLWFTLLGLTLRYCQAALNVEREYKYLHRIEALLAEHVHAEFGREGVHYRSQSRIFTEWAHAIYVYAFPILLVTIVLAWTIAQLPTWRAGSWPASAWFELCVSAAIVASLALYVVSHRVINARKDEDRS